MRRRAKYVPPCGEDGTMDWFKIEKGLHQGCILSPCLFNLNAEYVMRNARLDEAQAGIKIARRNINNLRYADDIALMARDGAGDPGGEPPGGAGVQGSRGGNCW